MNHYLDIHLRHDAEIAAAHLMSALFGKLHQALVTLSEPGIGISFPGHDPSAPHLGGCLRLHGALAEFQRLTAQPWLGGLQDHVRLDRPQLVPTLDCFRVVRRVQAKSSPERLRRRQMRRHGYDEAEAQRRIPEHAGQQLKLPYVSIQSASTGQAFRLFIEHGPLLEASNPGNFSAYGLSTDQGTIPWF